MKKRLQKLLPILQSSLPAFSRMIPYLEQIEANRCHSNFGKLFNLFESRMAEFFNVEREEIAVVCNGTQALIASLMALNISREKYCLLPSWTFSATPAAAMAAGLKPFFLDVDKTTQTLTPEKVRTFLSTYDVPVEEIGAVLPVSPFGAPIPRQSWDNFTHETGIPVVIDAAASFDAVHRIESMQPGYTPIMVSLHATKIFGIGEGGLLLSKNTELLKRVKGISNFGFDISRVSSYPGTNAKMSEYQAGIGLAVLDSWPEIREKRLQVTRMYIEMFEQLGFSHWLSSDWVTNTCNVLMPSNADSTRDYLLSCNIESRVWWGRGCHTYPAYQTMPKEMKLPNTDYLSHCMLGVPCSIDTSKEEIAYIGECLANFIERQTHSQEIMAKRNS